MSRQAFPVIYVRDVGRALSFYEGLLGFEETYRQPIEGEPGYVGLTLGDSRMSLVDARWPAEQIGVERGAGPRFELFVYVEDVDAAIEQIRAAEGPVLREPEDMPWGERLGYVEDPDGNSVSLAASSTDTD